MNSSRAGLASAMALVVLATVGCASTGQRMETLERRAAALEAQVGDLQTSQQNIIARLVQVRQDLENGLQPMRTQQADRGEDLRWLQNKIAALEEQLGTTNRRLTELTEQLASAETATGAPPIGNPMPPPRSATQTRPGPVDSGGATPQRSAAEALYRTAYTDYLKENYGLAVAGFREYIMRYPPSDRADNAQYWIGESLFAQGDYFAARDAFNDLAERYPDGDMVAGGKLKAALALIELGDNSTAVEELVRLINDHQGTDEARIGCLQLNRLGIDPPPACPADDNSTETSAARLPGATPEDADSVPDSALSAAVIS